MAAYFGDRLVKTFEEGERDIDVSQLGLNIRVTKITGPLPKSLVKFTCAPSDIEELPELPNSLKELSVGSPRLKELPALPLNLEKLLCSDNQLTRLPTLPSKLRFIDCRYNNLTELPTLPPILAYLSCGYNPLRRLPALPKSLEWISLTGVFTLEEPFATLLRPYTHFHKRLEGKELETVRLRIDEILAIEKKLSFLERAGSSVFTNNNTNGGTIMPTLQGLPNVLKGKIASFTTAKNGTLKNQKNRLKNNLRNVRSTVGGRRVSRKMKLKYGKK